MGISPSWVKAGEEIVNGIFDSSFALAPEGTLSDAAMRPTAPRIRTAALPQALAFLTIVTSSLTGSPKTRPAGRFS